MPTRSVVLALLWIFSVTLFGQDCPGTGNLVRMDVLCCGAETSGVFCQGTFSGNCIDLAGPIKQCGGGCEILQGAICIGGTFRQLDIKPKLSLPTDKKALACSNPALFEQWLAFKADGKKSIIAMRKD